MPTLVVLATADHKLADIWEKQIPDGRAVLRLGQEQLAPGGLASLTAVVVLDAAFRVDMPPALRQSPTIFVGEPFSEPFEQAKATARARIFLSYDDSVSRLQEFLPLLEDLAEKQSMLALLSEKLRRGEALKDAQKPITMPHPDILETLDFLEGAVENLDSRERLISEFRRASRHLLRASHAVFFLRDGDIFRADRGTSYFGASDPLVAFFESHPVVIDGLVWDVGADPVAEVAVRNRLALWGARLLVPVHDNGRLLGLLAFGIKDDGQSYLDADKARAVFLARLLRHCLVKSAQVSRLSVLSDQVALGGKYLPSTVVLGTDEGVPLHVPLLVRDLIGKVRRTREVCRVSPSPTQPFRASAGIIHESGGAWAFWEEASAEVHDSEIRLRLGRRRLLHDIALTLSHEIGNALVSLATLRHISSDKQAPVSLMDTVRADVAKLEKLNKQLGVMQTLSEAEPAEVDIRELAQHIGKTLSLRVEVGPDAVPLTVSKDLVEFALRALIETVVENRPDRGTREMALQVRSSGSGADVTALLSIKGKQLELEGILPEATDSSVPSQGRLGVFLAKEVLRLHHGEIHSGPGMEGTEILISIRNL
jgi:hypothetical protein